MYEQLQLQETRAFHQRIYFLFWWDGGERILAVGVRLGGLSINLVIVITHFYTYTMAHVVGGTHRATFGACVVPRFIYYYFNSELLSRRSFLPV